MGGNTSSLEAEEGAADLEGTWGENPRYVRSDSLLLGRSCACGPGCQCSNGWTSCNCGESCECPTWGWSGEASLVMDSLGIDNKKERLLLQEDGQGNNTDPLTSSASENNDVVIEMVVSGMTCTMCSQSIAKAVSGLNFVKDVTISLSTDIVRVQANPDAVDKENDDPNMKILSLTEEVQETIEAIGYDVEEILSPTAQDHAYDDEENHNDDEGHNSTREGDPQERWNRINERQEQKLSAHKRAFLWSLVGTIPILVITMILPHVPLYNPDDFFSIHLGNQIVVPAESLLLWLLATPVQFISGFEFYKMAYYGIFVVGSLGMDVLVAMGTTASYGYALYATLFPICLPDDDDNGDGCLTADNEAHFFETSAVLISFILLGKWMQALAVRRTSEALNGLLQLQPTTAIRVLPQYNKKTSTWNPQNDAYDEEEVPIKDIRPGDYVKVVKGASIPADGFVAFGEIAVDESMVTGESLPALKTPGSVVLGATVCVESGSSGDTISNNKDDGLMGIAFCKITGVGSSTALSQIIRLVQDAQGRHVPIQSFADRISSVFVPVVVLISIITFLVWYAMCSAQVVPDSWLGDEEDPMTFSIMFAIACLVISCPCALGLATPTAVMVGTGVGAQLGVLIKGGDVLEEASKVDTVIFDKTGTLTTGKPVVVDFQTLTPQDFLDNEVSDSNRRSLLWLLGSLERSSEHPLAKAVVNYTEQELGSNYLEYKPFAQPFEFRAVTGRGASGYVPVGSKKTAPLVAVGNRAFATLMEIPIPTHVDQAMKQMEQDGKTAILAAIDKKIWVIMGVMDELKSDAADSISYLKNEMGIDVWMVTGDNARTAQAIARHLNLEPERVVSEALPSAKIDQVTKLQQQGKVVAMIGDGVNDSPALAKANVGLGIGTGAAIAAEASDMVLVKGQNVADVCVALDLSRAIFRRIQWNFLWSLIYNCLGIPIAAGIFFPFFHTRLPPTVAALAMASSSVSVVFSSLLLRFYKPKSVQRNEALVSTPNLEVQQVSALAAVEEGMNNAGLKQPLLSNEPTILD